MPDAFLIPHQYPAVPHAERLYAIKREFSKLMEKSVHTWVRSVTLGRNNKPDLITPDLKHTYYFGKGHSLEGHDRFIWTDLPNGVKSGVLVPDPDERISNFLVTATGQNLLADGLNEAAAIVTEERTSAQ